MKKILTVIFVTAILSACGDGKNDSNDTDSTLSSSMRANSLSNQDSTKKAADSIMMTGDTSALNKKSGDTTSASAAPANGAPAKPASPKKKGK